MRMREALADAVGTARLEVLEGRLALQDARLEADHLPWMHAHVARLEHEHAELTARLAAVEPLVVGAAAPVTVRRWRRGGRGSRR
jgi:uncharacterized coiled-coil protein SlyX